MRILTIACILFSFIGGTLTAQIPSPPTDGSLGPIFKSRDGISWAARKRDNGPGELNISILVNGIAYGKFRDASEPVWAPKGNRWYTRVELTKQVYGLLIDGKQLGPFSDIQGATFDTSGAKLSFAFKRSNSWYIWQNGKELGAYESAGIIRNPGGYLFGSWGSSKSKKITLMIDNQSFGPYDWINTNIDWISTEGETYITRVNKSGINYILQDGKEVRRDNVNFQLIPKGGFWYSWASSKGIMFNINGLSQGPFTMPPIDWGGGGPFFFADGKTWAMSTLVPNKDGTDSRSQVIINGNAPIPGWNVSLNQGEKGEEFTWFNGGKTSDLEFYRFDGKSIAKTVVYSFSENPDGLFLKIGEKNLGPYKSLSKPSILPNGKHWVVIAQIDDRKFRAIYDGVEGITTPEGIGIENLMLDPSGLHFTYHLRIHSNDLVAFQITDNNITGPFPRAGMPRFSINGKHSMLFYEPAKLGNIMLEFDGKSFGPYLGLRAGDRQYFDLENGHFVFQNKKKSGIMAVTDQGNFGPYEEVYPLTTGPRVANNQTGLLWGFVGRLKNGKAELYVFSWIIGGGKFYQGVQLPSEGGSEVSADGQDWFYPLAPPQNGKLHNGELNK